MKQVWVTGNAVGQIINLISEDKLEISAKVFVTLYLEYLAREILHKAKILSGGKRLTAVDITDAFHGVPVVKYRKSQSKNWNHLKNQNDR